MKIYFWKDIFENSHFAEADFFAPGCGITVGSFDGIHQGHSLLLKTLVNNCEKKGYLKGVVTFTRPLPSIKHSADYVGDVSTLNQRMKLLEGYGIDFVIISDFEQSFSELSGVQFFTKLIEKCNLKLIAEGVDFRCGYKGATDASAIRYFAEDNGLESFFVEPVFYKPGTDEEERISSSYIRQMIKKGFLATVEELLQRKYSIDFGNELEGEFEISQLNQVIPPVGVYHCKNEAEEEVRVEITSDRIYLNQKSKEIIFK